MKRYRNKPIKASTSISELSALDLINILQQTPELQPYDIALNENPDGSLQIAVGDTVYDIVEDDTSIT